MKKESLDIFFGAMYQVLWIKSRVNTVYHFNYHQYYNNSKMILFWQTKEICLISMDAFWKEPNFTINRLFLKCTLGKKTVKLYGKSRCIDGKEHRRLYNVSLTCCHRQCSVENSRWSSYVSPVNSPGMLTLKRRVIWKYYMMTQFHIYNEIGSALLLNTNI